MMRVGSPVVCMSTVSMGLSLESWNLLGIDIVDRLQMKPLLANALILTHPFSVGVLGFGNIPLSNDSGHTLPTERSHQCHVGDPVGAHVDEAERMHPASTSPQVHASYTSPLQGKWTGNCSQVLHLASSPRGLLHMHGFNTSISADSKLATSTGGYQMLSNYHSRHQQQLR